MNKSIQDVEQDTFQHQYKEVEGEKKTEREKEGERTADTQLPYDKKKKRLASFL